MSEYGVELVPVDVHDAFGHRRVLVPSDGSVPAEEGIPISLDVRSLYRHMPAAFVAQLSEALWAVGLVEPKDFLVAGAADKVRAALLGVVKYDALDILSLATEEMKHG